MALPLSSHTSAIAAPPFRIALLGSPNTGKTTLFNRLCGVTSKTANFPGTTTRSRVGRCQVGELVADVVDLPGLYRLSLDLPESRVCRAALQGEGSRPDLALVVLDATNLTRNLVLLGELQETGLPVVVALNMFDLARRRGLSFDLDGMSALLGCPVVPLVARRAQGLPELQRVLAGQLAAWAEPDSKPGRLRPADFPSYEDWAERVMEGSVRGRRDLDAASEPLTERLDQAFTHPLLGLLVFAAVMTGLFWILFVLAEVPMSLIEATFDRLGVWTASVMPAGAVRDLLVQGVIGGLAGTVVFLPQICLLFFLISLLEDTGYLARAAFVMDRILSRFGLPGHAFVPLLSSHACAIPGIMAARTIPDWRDRLTTIMIAPLMTCSARLPVYSLLIVAFIPARDVGPFNLHGLVMFGLYAAGILSGLLVAFVLKLFNSSRHYSPLMLELPDFQWPHAGNLLLGLWERVRIFLSRVGGIILALMIVLWFLSSYPAPPSDATGPAIQYSFAGRLGAALQQVFEPIGFNWQISIALVPGLAAREVAVGALGTVYALSAADEDVASQLEPLISSSWSLATAFSLLVWYIFAPQCLSTLAVVKRETNSWRYPLIMAGYLFGLAYLASFITYRALA